MHDITERVKGETENRKSKSKVFNLSKDELARYAKKLESEMKTAAKSLEFEKAAMLRDEMVDLKRLIASQKIVESEVLISDSRNK